MKEKIQIIFLLIFFNHCYPRISDKIIIGICIPKSGTHLFAKCLNLLTGKKMHLKTEINLKEIKKLHKSFFFLKHLKYTKKHQKILDSNNIIKFFLYRDPRDQIVSWYFWSKKRLKNDYEYYKKLAENPKLYIGANYLAYASLSFDEHIMKLICEGSPYYDRMGPYLPNYITHGILDFYNSYLPWMKVKGFCNVKFENLVGPLGGGSLNNQISEILKISNHLGIKINEKKALEIAQRLYGDTNTFSSGKTGSWKNYFTIEHISRFKKITGNLLLDLQYETKYDW